MRHQPVAVTERIPPISTFRGGLPIPVIAPRVDSRPDSVAWLPKPPGLQPHDRTPSIDREGGASADADPAKSLRKADRAFQRAMRRAIAQGLEHPPMIGVFKDARPPQAPRLFDPVPHSSGCTSAAQECAELASCDD